MKQLSGMHMEQTTLIEYLMEFGLTRQEAFLYLSLSVNGIQTGYELSKATGISRSNVYSSLSALEEKGAAYCTQGKSRRYAPVEPEEFCANKIHSMQEKKRYLTEWMPRKQKEPEGYLTITGDGHITDKIRHMLGQAQWRVYLSISAERLSSFLPEIQKLLEQGKKVVLLTDHKIALAHAQVYVTDPKENQIGLIMDSAYVLTGELGKGRDSVCLYSGQKNFVKVFKDALRNEIALIELLKGEKSNEEKTIRDL